MSARRLSLQQQKSKRSPSLGDLHYYDLVLPYPAQEGEVGRVEEKKGRENDVKKVKKIFLSF